MVALISSVLLLNAPLYPPGPAELALVVGGAWEPSRRTKTEELGRGGDPKPKTKMAQIQCSFRKFHFCPSALWVRGGGGGSLLRLSAIKIHRWSKGAVCCASHAVEGGARAPLTNPQRAWGSAPPPPAPTRALRPPSANSLHPGSPLWAGRWSA